MTDQVTLTGWGRTAPSGSAALTAQSAEDVAQAVRGAGPRGILVRGLGRSYGDAAQNAGGQILSLSALDAIGPIDPVSGEVTCGAGVSVDQLLRHAVPRGWFVPVSPGTRQVSLGGAVAADVHGKNHHRDGTIGRHVDRLTVIDGRGDLREIPSGTAEFDTVIGGLGLAGIVTALSLRLRPIRSAQMLVDTVRTSDLHTTMSALQEADGQHAYSVAWLDCLAEGPALGRGVVTSGDHAPGTDPSRPDDLAFDPRGGLGAPPWVPRRMLTARRVSAFNAAYYRRAPSVRIGELQSIARFFHPLDGISGWNRLYGRDGFVQYQFAAEDPGLVARVLVALQRAQAPAFLAVLKRFGPANSAPLSFPIAGWTLAVDLPADPALAATLDRIDRLVADSGGRVYLAKDSRLRPDLLAAMYPEVERWREQRERLDPHHVFRSDLARRLHL